MKNSHKIGLLCCALTPTAFAEEPTNSDPVSDVIKVIAPSVETIPPEQLTRKEEELKWDVTEATPPTTRWNNAFSFKVKSGMMSHSHQMKNIKNSTSDIDAKATSPYVGGGLSWSIGSFSLTANGQRTDRRNIGAVITRDSGSTVGDRYEDSIFWREDYDASASWRFNINSNHSVSLFGGYRWGKTHYDTKKTSIPLASNLPTKTTTETVTGTDSTGKPISLPDTDQVIDRDKANAQIDVTKVLFDSKGPFIGLGYTWRISELSDTRIGFSLAYGKLAGKTNETTISGVNGEQGYRPFTSDGTQGLRYGLFLTGPISRSKWGELNYTLGVDAYNYTIKQSYLNTRTNALLEYTNKEKILSVGGSIGYTFDL